MYSGADDHVACSFDQFGHPRSLSEFRLSLIVEIVPCRCPHETDVRWRQKDSEADLADRREQFLDQRRHCGAITNQSVDQRLDARLTGGSQYPPCQVVIL